MEYLFQSRNIETDLVKMKLIITFAPEKFSETHNSGNHLAYNGCISCARNSPFKNSDKNNIENYICYGSYYQETERVFGIAHCLKNSCTDVIGKSEETSQKIYPEIGR